jgi:hypothetical protein
MIDGGLRREYSRLVADKEATEFSSSIKKADTRRQAVFFRPNHAVPSMGGDGGEASACRVPSYRSANPAICRPPSFSSERSGSTLKKEALMPSKRSPKILPTASFKSFSWLREDCQTTDTDILELAKDIAAGVKLSLQLIEKASEEAENREESLPYLNEYHTSVLHRYAVSSCEILGQVIERRFDRLNDRSMKEADE